MEINAIESGLQLFSRLNHRPSLSKLNSALFEDDEPGPNELVEITGAAGSGKTLLVMDFLARSLLPRFYKSVALSGKNCGAVFINTDHHFDLFRLISIMEFYIKKTLTLSQSRIEEIVKSSLNNLIILDCYDSHQLQMTFLDLERIIMENVSIGLVVIDSISAYYWEHRNSNGIIGFQAYHTKILDSLVNNIKNSNTVVIFTRIGADITLDVNRSIILGEIDGKFNACLVVKDKRRTIPFLINNTIEFMN